MKFLFSAPIGTGKSTHIRLWKQYLGEKVQIVNGDKPFVHFDNNHFYIYGTPWSGKEHWHQNCCEELKGICILEQGTSNSIREASSVESLSLLLKQIYLPTTTDSAACTLELLNTLISRIPIYILTCNISEEAVRCSFEKLTGMTYPSLCN